MTLIPETINRSSNIVNSASFEKINCNICGAQGHEVLFKSGDIRFGLPGEYNVVKCPDCGLIYVDPRPDAGSISMYYPKAYPPHSRAGNYYKNGLVDGVSKKILKAYESIFEKPIIPFGNMDTGKILDIGCGSGIFLEQRRKEGWDTYGLDVSPEAVKAAGSIGLNVFCGTLEEAKYEAGFFDVVTMNHSLEHLHDPSSALKEAFRILKPGGILAIVVPNIESLDARIFKKYWDAVDVPRHLYHFSRHTLQSALNNAGFTVEKVRYSPTSVIFGNSLNMATNKKYSVIFKNPLCYMALFPITIISSLWGKGSIMSVLAIKK